MDALDERIAPRASSLEVQIPVPSRLDDPAATWLRWLTTPAGLPVDEDHPLTHLCAGTLAGSWSGLMYTGQQGWLVQAARVHDRVEIFASAAEHTPERRIVEDQDSGGRDVTGRVLSSEELARADALFRGTVESLHQAIYLYRPIWAAGRIVDLEIVYCNAAALALAFTSDIVPGALASKVFNNPELAMLEAEEAWEHGSTTPYSIERSGLLDGVERIIRYEIRTRRVADHILQTSTDHTIADELQRSEARQRLVLDALNEGVTLLAPVFDAQQQMVGTRVLYRNRATEQFRGTGVGIFEGATAQGDELDVARRTWETGDPAITVIDHLDGGTVDRSLFVELEAVRVDEVIVQVVRDRTEEMRSSRDRDSAERRFRGTIESLEEAVGIWAPIRSETGDIEDFVLRYANPSFARHSSTGTKASRIGADVDLVAVASTAFKDGRPVTLPMTFQGPRRSITWRTSLVRVDGDIVSVASDITEVQQVLGRLSASDSLLRSVLDSLAESVRVFNGDGKIEYANVASVALLGPLPWPGDPDPAYTISDLDGNPLTREEYPLERGLRGESITDMVVVIQLEDGSTRVCSVTVRPLFDAGSSRPSRVVVSAHDITAISQHAAELEWLATHKRQTSLLNLDGFIPVVHERTLKAGGSFALIWLSLSELDTIRPTFGFAAGDAALVGAAERVAVIAEQYGAVAAQPEDSALALLIPHVASGAEVQRIANDLVHDLSKPFVSDSMSLLLGPSAGCTIGPLHGNDADTLIRRAKTAAWHANKNGVNVLRWRADVGAEELERVSLLGEFDRALSHEEIFLEFQPKLNATTHQLMGAEALVRWMHPTKGRIGPQSFVEGVEASALCRPFTLWAIRSALTKWEPVAEKFPGTKVAVNVPVPLISDIDFMEQLADELVSIGVDPEWLQIEITERGLVGSIPDLQAGLEQISMLGISIALDDFGTGQSSLSFLRKLTLNEVKIDRAFITNLQVDLANQAVVSACVAIAGANGMKVCAEGVETEEELEAVAKLGCDYVQGFLLGRPMSITNLLLRND